MQQHLAPVLRLQAALAGLDGDDGVAVVELAGEPARELQVVQGRRKLLDDLHRVLLGLLVVGLACQLVGAGGLAEQVDRVIVGLDVVAQARDLPHDALGGRRVVPKAGLGGILLQGGLLLPLDIDGQVALHLGKAFAQVCYLVSVRLDWHGD